MHAVDYLLLKEIAEKSEVVDAILRRTVDDVIGNGYQFVLADGVRQGDPAQLERLKDFFMHPNTEDLADEWLEALIYDLQLYGDAWLELSGTDDQEQPDHTWTYGGSLEGVWHVDASTVQIVPGKRQIPDDPEPAYVQVLDQETVLFAKSKLIHISRLKRGRAYGSSPLLSLLRIVSGQLNLTDYVGQLFSGNLPKTLLNVGDISTKEMDAMLGLIEQQVSGGKSPFGLIALNGGTGFGIHKLIDSAKEGQFLDQLYYYREEICSVFGIPPMKLGWVQTGKLSNPEQQLDTWYDVVDSFHRRIEGAINRAILPLLQVSDWQFKFNPIRPKREKEKAETMSTTAKAIADLRQEGAISINEARSLLGMEFLDVPEADDPLFLSPKLTINQSQDGSDEPPATEVEPVPLEEPTQDPDPVQPPLPEDDSWHDEEEQMTAFKRGDFVYMDDDEIGQVVGLYDGDVPGVFEQDSKKYDDINFKPTEAMAKEAVRGLEWRAEFNRGGTMVGVARARQLKNRTTLSPRTVRRMKAYFDRHEVDKKGEGYSPGEDGYPSAGRIAWALWGGDAGYSWARNIVRRMNAEDERD